MTRGVARGQVRLWCDNFHEHLMAVEQAECLAGTPCPWCGHFIYRVPPEEEATYLTMIQLTVSRRGPARAPGVQESERKESSAVESAAPRKPTWTSGACAGPIEFGDELEIRRRTFVRLRGAG